MIKKKHCTNRDAPTNVWLSLKEYEQPTYWTDLFDMYENILVLNSDSPDDWYLEKCQVKYPTPWCIEDPDCEDGCEEITHFMLISDWVREGE